MVLVPLIQEQTAVDQEPATKLARVAAASSPNGRHARRAEQRNPWPSTKTIKLLNDVDALRLCRATLLQKELGGDDSLKAYCLEGVNRMEHDAKRITGHERSCPTSLMTSRPLQRRSGRNSILKTVARTANRLNEFYAPKLHRPLVGATVEVVDWIQTVTLFSVCDASLAVWVHDGEVPRTLINAIQRQVSQWTLEAVTQQSVFFYRVKHVPVAMQQQAPTIQMVLTPVGTSQDHGRLASRKNKISMETESAAGIAEMFRPSGGVQA